MFNKKLLSSIDLGKYKKKNPYKNDIILDPMGQWKHPGKNTRIPSSSITMKGVNYPVLGVSNTGQKQMMQPGQEYNFPGADYVDEYPQMKKGGLPKAQKGLSYNQRMQAYNDSLSLYNSYNEFMNVLKNPKYNNKSALVSNFQGKNQGWGPMKLPGNPYQNISPIKVFTHYQGNQPWRVFKYKKPIKPVQPIISQNPPKPCVPKTTIINNVPEKAPSGKKLVGTNSETLPVTGKKCEYVQTINPIYEDIKIEPIELGRFPERIDNGPLPPLQVHDYTLSDSIEAPQYTLDPYTADRLRLSVTPGKSRKVTKSGRLSGGQRYKHTEYKPTKDLEFGKKEVTKPIAALVQKLTGYDPKYFEGYEDEEGNFVPGELDYGNATGSEMEFRGAASLRDYMNQQKYKKEYAEYDKKLDTWLEQYEQSKKKQAEGQAFKKGGAKKKYTSDIINSTNYLFAEHPLFKKKKQSKKRIYDPKAKYYADGGENLQEKCPPYHYWNGETCVPVDRKLAPLDPQYLLENPDVATNMQIEPEVSVSPLGSDFSKALSWINKWHDSPMHDKMLLKSSKLSTRTDSDGEKLFKEIKDLRKKNIQTIPALEIDFDKTNPNAKLIEDLYGFSPWGISDSNTGNVSIHQSFPGNKQMLVHEISHSSDRPAGELGRLIPYGDQLTIQYRVPLNWKNSQYGKNEMAKFKNSQSKLEDEYMGEEEIPREIYEQNKFDDWNNYLLNNKGSEVRSRLREIQFGADEQNIYDPFNKKITGRQFKQLDKKLLYSKPLDELRKTYSDKDIKWMLNNISKNDNETDDTIQYGKTGGQLSKAKYGHSIGNLIRKQKGGEQEAMNAMMKARLAYANMFGNPSAQRMINIPDQIYEFDNGDMGTHYMASMDNYAVPQIQSVNGVLQIGDYGPESSEAIRFDSDEDANYFAEHYKDVSPGFMDLELTKDEIKKYVDGGYVVEDISVPSLTRMDEGGEKRKKRKSKEKNVEVIDSTEQPITPENIEQVIEKPEVEVNPAQERVPLMMQFSNEFQENNPYDAYYEKAAYDYLKSKKGWNEALGINKSNLPENVAKRIQNNYYKDLEKYVIGKSKSIQKDYMGKFDKKGNWKPLMGKINTLNPLSKRPTGHGSWDNYGDGSIQLVYPEQLFMGPGAGMLGLAGRAAAKGISNLAKSSLIQGTKAALSQPIANIPGVTIGNAIASGFAADAVVNRFPKVPSQIAEGNYSGALENVLFGTLDVAGANMMSPLLKGIGKGVKALPGAIRASKESGLLSNTYKLNPFAIKENPETFLYRVEPTDFNSQSTIDFMKQEIAAGREKPWYKGTIKSYEEGHPKLIAQNDFHGQWFEKNPSRLDFYLKSGDKYDVGTPMSIIRKKLPTSEANKFSVVNNPKANVISASPETEFVLSRDMINSAERFPESSWQQLIQEDKAFNTPNWLRGYKEVPVELPGSPNTSISDKLNPLELKVGDFDIDKFKGMFRIPTQGTNSLTLPGSPNARTFISEIDWSKWNPETPNYPELINEYNAIEKLTKANGTWMKNPDGSPFVGSKLTKKEVIAHPKLSNDITNEEIAKMQFIQQQSSLFKKAFGNSKLVSPDGSPWILQHGSPKKFDTFDESKFQLGDSGYSGSGIYTVPPKGSADSYTISGRRFHTGDIEPTLYRLYGQGNNPITSAELIKLGANSPAGKEMDLFNFHRKSAPLNEQLLDYDVAIHNQSRGIERVRDLDDAWEVVFPTNKQLKSATGNVGFFDMTNPNIYKGLVPLAVGAGAGALMANPYQDQSPIGEYKNGGQYGLGDEVDEATMKQLKKLGYTFEKI